MYKFILKISRISVRNIDRAFEVRVPKYHVKLINLIHEKYVNISYKFSIFKDI